MDVCACVQTVWALVEDGAQTGRAVGCDAGGPERDQSGGWKRGRQSLRGRFAGVRRSSPRLSHSSFQHARRTKRRNWQRSMLRALIHHVGTETCKFRTGGSVACLLRKKWPANPRAYEIYQLSNPPKDLFRNPTHHHVQAASQCRRRPRGAVFDHARDCGPDSSRYQQVL